MYRRMQEEKQTCFLTADVKLKISLNVEFFLNLET